MDVYILNFTVVIRIIKMANYQTQEDLTAFKLGSDREDTA